MTPDPEKTTDAISADSADASQLKSRGGFERIAKATRYSIQGLRYAFRHEAAFRQELMLMIPLTALAWWLPMSRAETVLLMITMMLVLIVELLNSAVEAVVDRVSLQLHPLAGHAKDLGSAAVFFSLLLCALAWLAIVGPVIWQWLH